MRSLRVVGLYLAACLAVVTPAVAPAFAMTNGTPDGNAHPSVGFIIGTDSNADNCSGFHQYFSNCSAVLIADDAILTTRNCASVWQNALNQGIVDEVWVIFGENPFDAGGTNFDCTRFRDIDESLIHFDPNIISAIGLMELTTPVTDIVPVQLPVEDRLQNVPRGQNDLTFVAMSSVPGQSILSLRRRSATGRTDPPLTPNFHPVTVTSPAGACFGDFTEGGATFVGDTNEIVSFFTSVGGCVNSRLMPRLDIPDARAYLSQFIAVP